MIEGRRHNDQCTTADAQSGVAHAIQHCSLSILHSAIGIHSSMPILHRIEPPPWPSPKNLGEGRAIREGGGARKTL